MKLNPGVLTAAHCKVRRGDLVVLGVSNIGEYESVSGRIDAVVDRVYSHPKYNPRTSLNDIAVVRLKKAVTTIVPVKLQSDPRDHCHYEKESRVATTMGWGRTLSSKIETHVLMKVDIPLVSRAVCSQSYPGQIRSTVICAGFQVGGKDTCFGDQGGPLVVRGNANTPDVDMPVQVGVVLNWGYGCALPDTYGGVYTKVSVLFKWVATKIGPGGRKTLNRMTKCRV